MSFIATIEAELASVRSQIDALVAEQSDLEAALRVFARLGGDTESTGNVGASAGRSHSERTVPTQSPASVPVDTNSHSQQDAGDHAGADPHSLAGMSNSPEGASDVAADRARKPSVHPDAEPVRQAGGNASPAAPSLAARLRALNSEHPEYTIHEVAEALGETVKRVTDNSSVHKIRWRGVAVGKTVAKPAQPHPEPEAPEPIPGPERPPALTAAPAEAHPADSEPDTIPSFLPARAPIAVHPSGSGSAVITKPMARAPKGTRFILQDDAGLYLHYGCEHMTNQRAYWPATYPNAW